MSEQPPPASAAAQPPNPPDQTAQPPQARLRRRARVSVIWVLPAVAAAIGIYLAFTTLSQRGPEIVLTFNSADGLTSGQTKVRHKAVDLGTITSIRLASDMSHVIVRVRMTREASPYLTDRARFWVVRPRLSASDISGLETLISGGYVEMDPGAAGGASKTEFTGLENPPGVRSDEPGTTFTLQTPRIGSLGSGSPVFYRDIVVGEVLDYHLPEGNGPISVHVFVRAPYDKWVRTGTRFWNASGLDVEFGGAGIHLELQSIQAVLSGGVAFGTPEDSRETPSAKQDAEFSLFPDENAASSAGYKQRIPFVLYYQTSVAGLSVGAPVQVDGIAVGNVTDVRLEFDQGAALARVRVGIEIQPERFAAITGNPDDTPLVVSQRLVDRGIRAQLTTISYLTGQLAVSLETSPGAAPVKVSMEGNAIVLPTAAGGGLTGLTTAVSHLASKLDSVPLDSIGNNLNSALASLAGVVGSPDVKNSVKSLQATLSDLQELVKHADAGLAPLLRRLPEVSADLQQTLAHTNSLVTSVDNGYGSNSQFARDLSRLLSQFNDAARSVRLLTDFLDRHPEALIRGRANEGAER